jgi:hypothetical protein
MTINSSTRVITWTPAAAGSYDITVEVSDGISSTTQPFTITVGETILILTSIVVEPSSISIKKGASKPIISVTAYYNNNTSTGTDIALNACTYASNVANVTVTNGVILVSATCAASTAIITVSYKDGVTKTDTVNVTITGG